MVISKSSVRRFFIETGELLRLLPVSLKLSISLLSSFLMIDCCLKQNRLLITTAQAAPESLSSSNQKSQRSTNVASNNSLNDGWRLQASFFDRHAEGWHWYELPSDNKVEEKKKNADPDLAQTPTEIIEGQRKKLEQKLHAAIVEPTREKIMAYIIAQKALMDQSQRFSESWQRVVMTTPALDETLVHPVGQNARYIYYQERNQEITSRIKALAQDYGLFFFFKGECAYCHHFAPVVNHFAKKHGWSVLGISMDGGMLPEFPHAKRDNGVATRLQITHVPALIAYHPTSGKIIPLAYGLISESEIEERVILLSSSKTSLLTRSLSLETIHSRAADGEIKK